MRRTTKRRTRSAQRRKPRSNAKSRAKIATRPARPKVVLDPWVRDRICTSTRRRRIDRDTSSRIAKSWETYRAAFKEAARWPRRARTLSPEDARVLEDRAWELTEILRREGVKRHSEAFKWAIGLILWVQEIPLDEMTPQAIAAEFVANLVSSEGLPVEIAQELAAECARRSGCPLDASPVRPPARRRSDAVMAIVLDEIKTDLDPQGTASFAHNGSASATSKPPIGRLKDRVLGAFARLASRRSPNKAH